ncbi:hypothetical protein [Paenibacillus larvae]|uniref:hypothetical protein n=1 Tax=Paenibacillus larvae TaxID=1464 RepID=UPI00288FE213|nr:hypothetical protein [Paenibacillus larvae]MDT2190953.1 hypothetical protein [Paenibacillus larvae]MDT2239049.1 hypothetical protein [Paenibacillus larvae]MDT2243139.1 hypothetical protein [Paenibacillus larvae]MDT2249680.1 hypothetical protein [Paenibacillus larvae]MDT2258225.1 hypothetical protein [Paenibacillus larvae]
MAYKWLQERVVLVAFFFHGKRSPSRVQTFPIVSGKNMDLPELSDFNSGVVSIVLVKGGMTAFLVQW